MEKGRNHLLDPDDMTKPAARLLQRRDQVHLRLLPRARPAHRAAGVPALGGRGRAHPRGRGELHPDHGRRRRHPCRRQGAAFPRGGLPPAVHPRAPGGRPRRRLAARLRRARALLRRGGAGHRRVRPGGGQSVRGLALAVPTRCRRAHPCTARCCRRAAAEKVGLHPYEAPTAANSIAYDGRPACNNCGFCAFFGCPIHAKGDPVALLDPGHGDRPGRSCCPRPTSAGS